MPSLKKSALGRGLDSLLADNSAAPAENGGVSVVKISEVTPNRDQPRKDFNGEELEALSASISQYGVIQPIIVRNDGKFYQIVAGERRWRAARMAGLAEIPVIVISADDKMSSELALVENLQRTELNPIEEAAAYSSLVSDYSMTQDEISKKIGKSRAYVSNTLRMLDLPEKVLGMLRDGALSAGHAKALLMIKDKDKIIPAAEMTASKGLSVRQTEQLAKKLNTEAPPAEDIVPAVDYVRELEGAVRTKLGRNVKIVSKGDKSTISIAFSDNNDLEGLLRLLCGDEFVDSLS